MKRTTHRLCWLVSLGLVLVGCTDEDEADATGPFTGAMASASTSTSTSTSTSGSGGEDDAEGDDDEDSEGTTGDSGQATIDPITMTSTTTTAGTSVTTTGDPSTTAVDTDSAGGSSGGGEGSTGFGTGGEICTPAMTPQLCVAFGAKVAECFGDDPNVEAQWCACDLEFSDPPCAAALEEYYTCVGSQSCDSLNSKTACETTALEMACDM